MKNLKKDYLYPVELKMARVLARVKYAVKEPIVQFYTITNSSVISLLCTAFVYNVIVRRLLRIGVE